MADAGLRRTSTDGVVTVTVDRPQHRNAMTVEAWLGLEAIVRDVRSDETARGLILTGSGDVAFASGADLGELVRRDPWVALDGRVQRILQELEDLPFPTVAALNGHALGGGWELALACDLRVAVTTAKVGFPEVGLGIVPGAGGMQRLLRHVGVGRAKELIMSARSLDAAEAMELGLVHRVVETGTAVEGALELLVEVVRHPALAVRLSKAVLNATAAGQGGAELERLAYTLAFHGPGRTERMQAFLDRRRDPAGDAERPD
jgi:enoyl-CoA hydratase/carnithine racemase